MKITSKKPLTKTTLLAISVSFLLLASAFAALPVTNAHTPAWDIPIWSYMNVSPNPIGVDQTAFIVFWFDKSPPTAAGSGGDRWTDITIEVTAPDNSKDTLGPFTTDSVGGSYAMFTPTQVGTYTFVLDFPGQTASLYHPETGVAGNPSDFVNDTYSSSTTTATLTVQEEPISDPISPPLPTSYWTRPIEGQNTDWSCIASNWLSDPFAYPYSRVQTVGSAPNSAHVMWTKEVHYGGVVGGSNVGSDGMTYYGGLMYECKFANPIIMQGRLYYSMPLSNSPSAYGFTCVDLTNGETLWTIEESFGAEPFGLPFAQLYDYESMNQHGVIPNGYIWRVVGSTWMAYDGFTGSWLFNLTNVPGGTNEVGTNGERLRYVLSSDANWLALWNNTAAWGLTGASNADDTSSNAYQWRPGGKSVDASTAYSWNVTLPEQISAGSAIIDVIPGDLVLGRSSAFAGLTGFGTPDPYTLWAISLKPESRGELLWIQSYDAPNDNLTRVAGKIDPATRVFTMYDKEAVQWTGYSLDTGDKVWGPTASEHPFNYYATSAGVMSAGTSMVAYGKLYSTGFSGILYCYDMSNGNQIWNYSTPSGFATPYGGYSSLIGAISDGKVYTYFIDHSPNAPPYKGVEVRCINATTGDEVWTIMGWGGDRSLAIADGCLTYYNLYDGQIYCVGKGPTATTVSAPQLELPKGSQVLITGTVTDVCAGAKELVETGEFNVVPAVSDESMSDWMEYLYMQKPMPPDADGVTVKLTAIDPNGNTQDLGTATTDTNGNYAVAWTPPVEGIYQVTATFHGTNSYYGSTQTAYFIVGETTTSTTPAASAQPTPTQPTQTPPQSASPSPSIAPPPTSDTPTTTYIAIGAAAAIIIIIAAAIVLRKRQ
ncbi:MAG: hypothetical protein NWF04_04740 [Candidatus Bathyarchaeota archaeon]|nr:hypothetical protein [Candidatus Bathyarchaeota archaeon]